jgi:hypothetical protein
MSAIQGRFFGGLPMRQQIRVAISEVLDRPSSAISSNRIGRDARGSRDSARAAHSSYLRELAERSHRSLGSGVRADVDEP